MTRLVSEQTPLLSDSEQQGRSAVRDSSDEANKHGAHSRLSTARPWQVKSPWGVIVLVALIKFAAVCSGMMLIVPFYRLIEDMFCHAYYQDDSANLIEEMKCKVDHVQADLAYMIGWMGLLNSIIGLAVAFPYGMMSDKIGRKPTVILAYAGVACSFSFGPLILRAAHLQIRQNPYLLMTGSIFQVFGGGIQVLLATLYAIAADVSTEKEKAANFLYLTFGATAGGLAGPLLAGVLMGRYGPWVPIAIVGIVTPFIFLAIVVLLPETLPVADKSCSGADYKPGPSGFKEHMVHGFDELAHSVTMLRNVNIPLVLVTFLVQNARFTAYTSTVQQYISKHFGWRLADTSILLSPIGILNLAILAVLPKISTILLSSRFRYSAFQKDLLLTRISTFILVVGAVIQGLSHNVVVFILALFVSTFGAADSPLARATVTHYVPPEYTSRLYALIGMVEVLGSFIGGPVLAWAFNQGLKKRGFWIGLPWYYVGFLCFLSWLALVFVKAPSKELRGESTEGHEENINDYAPDDPLRPQ